MDESIQGPNGELAARRAAFAHGPFPVLATGGAWGASLCAIAGIVGFVLYHYDHNSRNVVYFCTDVLLPAALGGFGGAVIGLIVWAVRPRPLVSRSSLVVSRALLGGGTSLLLLVVSGALFGWITRASADLSGSAHGGQPTRMAGALAGVILGVLFLGLPVFAWGCIVGAILALTTRARGVGIATSASKGEDLEF